MHVLPCLWKPRVHRFIAVNTPLLALFQYVEAQNMGASCEAPQLLPPAVVESLLLRQCFGFRFKSDRRPNLPLREG